MPSPQTGQNPELPGALYSVKVRTEIRNCLASSNNNMLSVGLSQKVQGKIITFHDSDNYDEVSGTILPSLINSSLSSSARDGQQHTIKSFLERPVQVASVDWSSTQAVLTRIISLSLPDGIINFSEFFQKIAGFMAFRATTVVRLQGNPTRFQQGRLLMTYFPQRQANFLKYNEAMASLTIASQLPNVQFDPAKDSDIVLRIPFVSDQLYYNIVSGFSSVWGQIDVIVYSPLLASTGHLDCNLTMYVSFEDVEFEYPAALSLAQPQAGGVVSKVNRRSRVNVSESERDSVEKPISSWFNSTKDLLNFAGKIPVISSVTQPAAWFAGVLANTAESFGFSKPTAYPHPMNVHNKIMPYGINCDGQDNSFNYGLSQANEVSHLDGFAGTRSDDMALSNILSISCFFTSITWLTSALTGALLFGARLGPSSFDAVSSVTVNTVSRVVRVCPPMGYVAKHFSMYRGSIAFKFKFVKTEFHSGRLMFCFNPRADYNGTFSYSNAAFVHREIVDIRDVSEYTFVCKYASTEPFRRIYNSGVTATDSDSSYGSVYVFVVNPLEAPDNITSSINIIVEPFCCSDFEFAGAVPVTYQPYLNAANATAITPQVNLPNATPQAGDMDAFEQEGQIDTQKQENAPIGGSRIVPDGLVSALYCAGERIVSLRQVLKRASQWIYYNTSLTLTTTNYFIDPFRFSAMQIAPAVPMANGTYYTCDLVDYYAICYTFFRGSMRLKHVTVDDAIRNLRTSIIPTFPTDSVLNSITSNVVNDNGQAGMPISITNANYSTNEIQIPYMAPSYASPTNVARSNAPANRPANSKPCFQTILRYLNETTTHNTIAITTLRGIGEDFSFGFWTGTVPIIQVQASVPIAQTTTTRF